MMWRLFKWLRWTLLALLLLIILLLVLVSAIVATEPGSRWALNQAADRLPLELGEVSGNLITGLDITELGYPLEDQHYRVEGLSFRWQPLALLYSTVSVQSLQAEAVHVQLPPPDEQEPETADEPIDWPDIDLPVRIELGSVNLRNIQVHRGDTEFEVYKVSGSMNLRAKSLRVWELEVEGPGYELGASGDIASSYPYDTQLRVSWRYTLEELGGEPMTFGGAGDLVGDLNSIKLNHRLRRPLEVETEIRFWPNLDDPASSPQLVTDNLWPEQSLPQALLPSNMPQVATAGRLQLDGWLEDYHLELSGDVLAEGIPAVDFHLLGDGNLEQMAIEALRLTMPEGNLASYGRVQWLPELRWSLALDLDSFNPAGLALELLEDWSGNISGSFHTEGALEEGEPRVQVEDLTLAGRLRGLELTAAGAVRYDSERLLARNLSLALGDNQLTLSGTVAETFDLQGELQAPDLDQLDPALSGALTAQLQVSGTRDDPRGQVHLEANDLRWQEYGVDQLTLDLEHTQSGGFSLALASNQWHMDEQQLEELSLTGNGTLEEHQVSGKLEGGELGRVSWALAGGYVNERWQGFFTDLLVEPPDPLHWGLQERAALSLSAEAVRLEALCLAPQSRWATRRAQRESAEDGAETEEEVAARRWALEEGDRGRICLEGQWQQEAGALAQADIRGLPLRLAQRWLQPEVSLAGTLEGGLDFELTPENEPNARFNLETQDGAIHYQFDEDDVEVYAWDSTRLEGQWQPERLSGRFTSDWGEFGGTSATVGLVPETGELDGELQAQLRELAPLEALIPRLQEVSGELTADLQLAGNLEQPQLSGHIALSEAAAVLPELGLTLEEVSLTARAEADRIVLEGGVSSAPGQISLSGEILEPWVDAREVDIRLSGTNFTAINTNELRVQVSPDLRMAASNQGVVIEGEARIPLALATFDRLPETATRVSDDVVIRDANAEENGRLGGIEIRTDLTLTLGDSVRFEGFGLDSRLSGELQVIQSPERGLLTIGEVGVAEGSYEAYGQDLDIERGRLIFQGPHENPGLDIRATREVEEYIVGLEIGGTLQTPQSRIFSTPALPDSDAMAMLLTGRPLSGGSSADGSMLVSAIGSLGLERSEFITAEIADAFNLDEFRIQAEDELTESELHIGKYLTPRLFVRYVVGLFDQSNRVGMRYDLTEGLRLEAESGIYQSIDMIYRFER